MLLRAAVLVDAPVDRDRLLRLLAPLEVVSSVIDKPTFDAQDAVGFDLLLTSRTDDVLSFGGGSMEIVVLSETDDPEAHAELIGRGATAVLYGGLADEALHQPLAAIVQRCVTHVEQLLDAQSPDVPSLRDFVSKSPVMVKFLKTVHRVVDADASLLLLGETGVGKERLARAIHGAGPRKDGPFVAVNCGALPETLLESELFGHEKGAFTGAVRPRRGHFELAHRGTIFLDEIGEMPTHLQSRLLRVLQERCIQPVGSEREVPVDVRVMAATNRDLAEEINAGRFRADLYYRLGVVTLTIPALRERRDDIPELAKRYLAATAKQLGRPAPALSEPALATLVAYDWPGNVRELVNLVQRAVLLCEDGRIEQADFPSALSEVALEVASQTAPDELPEPPGFVDLPWRLVRENALKQLERRYLVALLNDTRGKVGEAARRAGMSERALYDKMKNHALDKDDFR